jgi:23S rRNA (uracil1939-C5)-methyltransferase
MVPSLVGVLRRTPKAQAKLLSGREWLEEDVNGIRLRAGGEAFFQINSALTPALVDTAMAMAGIGQGQRALDLFCGVGLFSLAMARLGAHVLGIEANRGAVRDAQFNAQQNGLHAEFRAGDAAQLLQSVTREKSTGWDVVLLDPPRAGAAECLGAVMKLQPQRIVYVSCDPATLARDLGVLKERYEVVEAVPVDLFPQTAHVESVVSLVRSE